MALPATDVFDNTGGSPVALQTYSGSWTISTGAFVVDNAADVCKADSSGAISLAYWNADSFNADQYSQGALTFDAGIYTGVAVRVTGSGNGYYFHLDTSTWYLGRVDAGTAGDLTSGSTTGFVDGDTFKLTASGTNPVVLTAYRNGSQIGTYNDSNASRKTTGSAGVGGYGQAGGSSVWIDNWEGGNLSTQSQAPRSMHQFRMRRTS
jgi:hypothetical protein